MKSEKEKALDALAGAVAKIALRSGISEKAVTNAIESAYKKAEESNLKEADNRLTDSESLFLITFHWTWRNSIEFVDFMGEPIPLTIEGEIASIESLIAKCLKKSGVRPPVDGVRRIVDWLQERGEVLVGEDGFVELSKSDYNVADGFRSSPGMQLKLLAGIAESLVSDDRSETRAYRHVAGYVGVSLNDRPSEDDKALPLAAEQMVEQINDNLMHRVSWEGEDEERVVIGFGSYYFETEAR